MSNKRSPEALKRRQEKKLAKLATKIASGALPVEKPQKKVRSDKNGAR